MKNIYRESFYGALVCFVILALLQPFGLDEMTVMERIPFLLGECVCVFVSICSVSLLLHPMSQRLDTFSRKSIWHSIIALVPNFALINIVTSALLLTYNTWFHFGSPLLGWYQYGQITFEPFLGMLWQVTLISIFVMTWGAYKQRNQQLKDELDEMKALNKLLEERQEAVAEEEPEPEAEVETCTIESSTNNLSLKVNPKDIIYIESMSNYADICYLEEGATKHITMRITLKQLRETLSDVQCLASCHRAFIVNINFIIAINTRPTGGYQLQIFGTEKQIPVSRSYTDEIKRRMV